MNKFKKLLCLGVLSLCTIFSLTGCNVGGEQPAAGVSIAGAENQTLGFTYLYDLGNGYKLYADNFTKIVYLRYDFSDGKGATSVGSVSMCPYISANGNYYVVNTQTRVIEELVKGPTTNTNIEEVQTPENPDGNETSDTTDNSTNSQQQDIEAILNENSQKNENANVSEQQYQNNAIDTTQETTDGMTTENIPMENTDPVEETPTENIE